MVDERMSGGMVLHGSDGERGRGVRPVILALTIERVPRQMRRGVVRAPPSLSLWPLPSGDPSGSEFGSGAGPRGARRGPAWAVECFSQQATSVILRSGRLCDFWLEIGLHSREANIDGRHAP